MNLALEMKNIDFSYDEKEVLKDLNFTVEKGKFIAIVGENGAGKSTLLNLLIGKLILKKGSINVFGKPLKNKKNLRKIAYISQNAVNEYRNFPTTVEEVVSIHLSYLKSKLSLDGALESMNLDRHKKHALNELSGGQIQRLAILFALIKEAELIVLDEATSGVDIEFTAEIYKELKTLTQKGRTILMVTHNLIEAFNYVDEVLKLRDKKAFFIAKSEIEKEFIKYGNF